MISSAWNNGKHHPSGAGYGIKISLTDRDQYFKREWSHILLELEGESELVEISIAKPSFWNTTCRELINKRIGLWLIKNRKAPWPKNCPPKIELQNILENRFRGFLVTD